MTARPPTPRREFLLATIPGGYVNLRCRCCGLVVRFVRGDDRAMRAWKAGHFCETADPSDTYTCPICLENAPTVFGPLVAAWRDSHTCVGAA